MKRLVVLATMLVGVLVLSSAALAQDQGRAKLEGGSTLLKVDRGTAGALADNGIKVRAVGEATGPVGSRVFRFEVTGGRVETGPVGGRIRHSGGLAFSGGGDRLVVRRFIINLDRGVLTARAGGARIPLLTLKGGEVDANGPVVKVSNVRARLTATAATALNDTFDTDLFEKGLLLGETDTTAAKR